jgi:two-component sensor histidine kinase/PAS domain-containing protein
LSLDVANSAQVLRDLCRERSSISDEDIAILENLRHNLQYFADLAGADIFIDVLTKDSRAAIVVAEAKPSTAPSLYQGSVVGEYAFSCNEPAVFQTFKTGEPTPGVQGLSQEGVPIIQTVTPIKNAKNRLIAVLIMERDNSYQVYQQKTVEFLSQTTQKLTDTLLNLANVEEVLPTLIHDALFIADAGGRISYANRVAHDLLREYSKDVNFVGITVRQLTERVPGLSQLFDNDSDADEVRVKNRVLLVRTLPILAEGELRGKVYLLRDITELRKKDRQLMAKSAVIKEIHHRVKNNLQTIASLMRLQMRRVRSDETRVAFQESINRIRCIALVHEMFSRESPEVVGLRECIRRIGQILVENMLLPGQEIAVEVSGEEIFIHSDQATPTAIIVNEIMQNSIKYAFPENSAGKISVFIENHMSNVKIVIRDNGRGFPPDFDQETNANLGLQITRALVTETLEGNILMYNDDGAVAEIEFPK